MPIKAVCADLDGTLLNEKHQISSYSIEVLKKLKERGVHFIVATGRPFPDVFATIDKCGLQPDFVISSNGGRVHDDKRHVVFADNFSPTLATKLVRLIAQPHEDGTVDERCTIKKYTTNFYRGETWMSDKRLEEMESAFNECFRCHENKALSQLSEVELEDIHEFFFLGKSEDLLPLERYLSSQYADEMTGTYSMPFIYDCVPKGVSKGKALSEVCTLLGVDLKDVACFGDGMNDEAMLAVAGKPFIMDNAQQRLKDALPDADVIGSNTEDGVARRIATLLSL